MRMLWQAGTSGTTCTSLRSDVKEKVLEFLVSGICWRVIGTELSTKTLDKNTKKLQNIFIYWSGIFFFWKARESTELGIGTSHSKYWESKVGILQNAQNVGDPKWEMSRTTKTKKNKLCPGVKSIRFLLLLFLWRFCWYVHLLHLVSAVWVVIRQIDCRASIRSILRRARGIAIHPWPICCPFDFFAPKSICGRPQIISKYWDSRVGISITTWDSQKLLCVW